MVAAPAHGQSHALLSFAVLVDVARIDVRYLELSIAQFDLGITPTISALPATRIW